MPRSLCEQSSAPAAGISLEDRPIFLAVSKSLQQGCAPGDRQKSRSSGTGEFMREAQSASLEVVVWGFGPRVVLVHGSVFNGPLTWNEQRPLGESWRLEVLNRRGYGKSPPPEVRSDFEEDARDIAALLGDDAHLVGHSYGAIGALYAAALRPNAVRSLTI
jgi:pimeloyl-ACP methyl ester carboxylesterase